MGMKREAVQEERQRNKEKGQGGGSGGGSGGGGGGGGVGGNGSGVGDLFDADVSNGTVFLLVSTGCVSNDHFVFL